MEMELLDTARSCGTEDFDTFGMLLLAAAGGYFDYLVDRAASEDLSFNLFYLIPVGITVWFVGIKSAVFMSFFFSAVSCFIGDIQFDKYKIESLFPPFWNGITGIIFFLSTAGLLYVIKKDLNAHNSWPWRIFLRKPRIQGLSTIMPGLNWPA